MRKLGENFIIKKWGTPTAYFQHKQDFLMKHQNADLITYDNDGNLVEVRYFFKPYQVAVESLELVEKLQEINKD